MKTQLKSKGVKPVSKAAIQRRLSILDQKIAALNKERNVVLTDLNADNRTIADLDHRDSRPLTGTVSSFNCFW